MIGIGILTALVGLVFYALIRSAGMADRKLEEIQRLTAERGGWRGWELTSGYRNLQSL